MKLEKIEPLVELPEVEDWQTKNKAKLDAWLDAMADKPWFVKMMLEHLVFSDVEDFFYPEIKELIHEFIEEENL